ncbi:hypothetical protein [Erwinia sp. CGal63]|uniref:hypothetical protein n=1 Tax=Erwinia sp. CGal63 TaxID=2919889 RepID=UPI003008CBA3
MLRFASIVLFIEPVADGPGLLSNWLARFFRLKPSLSRDAVTFHSINTHFCQAVAGFSAISPTLSLTLIGYKKLHRQTGLQSTPALIVTTYNCIQFNIATLQHHACPRSTGREVARPG